MTERLPYEGVPSRFGGFVRRNPIALKELRGRMRGSRAYVVLTVYVALMSLFAVALYLIYTASNSISAGGSGGVVGKLIFGGVVAIELFLVCFVAPAFTAGAISGERERQTFNLLRTTLLSSRRIVLGKLVSAMAYIVLLLLVAVPLQSLAFLMGGVTVEEVILSVVILLATALAYGSVGILFSAVTGRTLTASILTYSYALLTTVVLPIASLLLMVFMPFGGSTLSSSPLVETIMLIFFWLLISINPVAAAVGTEVMLLSNNSVFYITQSLSNGASVPLISPWVLYTAMSLIFTLVIVLITVNKVRDIKAD